MKRFSTRLSIGLTAATFALALPFVSQPVMASLQQAGTTIAQAMQRPQVKLNLSAQKQVKTAEKTSWQALKGNVNVRPGDVLRYTVVGQNAGPVAAKQFAMTQPIPRQMTYQIGSARQDGSANVVYSIDGGKSFMAEPKVKIKTAEGQEILQPAPAEVYTHVRWQFKQGLNPKAQVNASYDVTVR
jgi:uncharacterized repeat protein (TIGR01451 family)